MRQRNVRALRLSISLLAVWVLAADTPLSDRLREVEERYNSAKTLQVLFTEQYTPPGSIRRTESGVILLRKPLRMRWDYSQPKGKLFVCDGKFLWLYNPAENSVEQTPVKESDDMRLPLAFLLGKLHFEKEFRNIHSEADGFDLKITANQVGESAVLLGGIRGGAGQPYQIGQGDQFRPFGAELRLRPGEDGPAGEQQILPVQHAQGG